MQFKPKTEKELTEEMLLEPGEYDFEVVNAWDKRSKAGNQMIELKLCVFVGEGRRMVSDYLLESMGFKLRHFFECIGRMQDYLNGNIDASTLQGASGKVELKVEPANGAFSAKMAVADYVVEENAKPVDFKKSVTPATPQDDDAPF